MKLAFEPGSWSWHKEKLDKDALKRTLCEKHGIRLITIYDSCNLEYPPFDEDCYIFSYDLALEKDYKSLEKLLCSIMKQYQLDIMLFKDNISNIALKAKRQSRRRGTYQFAEELKLVNPQIEVLGEYHRTHEKVKCKCKVCGHIWGAIPSGVLRGSGCPKCGGSLKKTHEEFVKQISKISPNIEIVGEYTKDSNKIECRCKICNHVWYPMATSLVQRHGCPKCSARKTAKILAKPQDAFVEEMKVLNPNIRFLGEYKNAKTGLKCECIICKNIWEPKPDSLKRGRGCPICARKKHS